VTWRDFFALLDNFLFQLDDLGQQHGYRLPRLGRRQFIEVGVAISHKLESEIAAGENPENRTRARSSLRCDISDSLG
jgi:hypothetical protein